MGSEFILTQGMGQKLEFAVRRNGGTTEDIEFLSAGKNFGLIKLLQTGKMQLRSVLSGKSSVPYDVDNEGNLHFSVTSNGLTPEEWCIYLEHRCWRSSSGCVQTILRAQEEPTVGVTYNVVVRPGDRIKDGERTPNKVRVAAEQKGWVKPHWEVACLIRDTFTDEQLERMDLWSILVMHEPIEDITGHPRLLSMGQGDGARWLRAYEEMPDVSLGAESISFAFVLP